MAYAVELPVFQGPLDLLLHLIEREELDITRVSLAQVTDQYLAHLRAMEGGELADIADFLVIAARLILIKSEALLPRPPTRAPGEEDPGEELARQLQAYKRYKEIAGLLKDRETAGLRTYLRVAPPPKVAAKLDLSNVTPQGLLDAVRRALAAAPEGPPVAAVVAPPKITIRECVRRIASRLRQDSRADFFSLLSAARSRIEIIVTFLAVLELIKQRRISAVQEQPFGDITLTPAAEWTDEEIESEFGE